MDLELGSEYEAFRTEVAAFLRLAWPPKHIQDLPSAVAQFRQAAIARGYLYRGFPKRYGGSEQPADPMRARIIREAFGRVSAPKELEGPGVSMLAPTLLGRGAEWQKERFIGPTLRGEIVWCQGYSEPGAGSDLASLKTRGVLEGDEWVVTGQKLWTTMAHRADFMFALVRTEPEAPKHSGLSYLLIDMKQPGITVRPLKQMTGEREFNEVFLDGVRTPKDWIVGGRGEGWDVSRTTLKHERDTVGGATRTEAMFGRLVELARAAERDGDPALQRDDVRQELARIEAYVLAQRYSSYRQASMELAGAAPGLIGLLNKLNGTLIGHRIANLAQDLIADAGLSMPPVSRAENRGPEKWVNQIMGSLGVAIAGGASNIQRNVIAERGLGLPRDAGDRA
ncbi:acyl-CoA dehydrogenase family protein [Phenylobacterium sp.]|uniref:acyl-CoA dehydrogenase family protein n=1 Tax=Phenylobacterium sp. TaxID=1871053 RepID=UPI002DE8FFAD|nr:acyl-CoA dehydrogenase family protein [Phenylobacterium sp.]